MTGEGGGGGGGRGGRGEEDWGGTRRTKKKGDIGEGFG